MVNRWGNKAHLTSHSRMSGPKWAITPSWLSGSLSSFLYGSSVYSCHLLISSALLGLFLSFIEPIFAWNVPLVSLIFLKRSLKKATDFLFLGSKITADGDCSHEIKRHLLLGRKPVTNLDSILKSREIALPTKSIKSKLWFFQLLYGCENWTIKKACESHSLLSYSLWPHGLYSPWNSSGQNTGVDSCSFSRGFFQPRDQTQVSCITSGFLTSWATRNA